MHLLVLSAFRRLPGRPRATSRFRSQCTFWCSVLSDTLKTSLMKSLSGSQCTFWCSVLSDNAALQFGKMYGLSQCTFWCSVLSDTKVSSCVPPGGRLNAPFGAQCFPTISSTYTSSAYSVSMHLLVLSAFRPVIARGHASVYICLNAPFGAQCFPTWRSYGMSRFQLSLNAPFGAQCFPTCQAYPILRDRLLSVSMHLLVLSAFRPFTKVPIVTMTACLNAPFGAQCFPT